MDITIKTNIADLIASLDSVARDQVPFASALALTRIAQRVKSGERRAMARNIDRPTPFTMNSLYVKPAKKNDPNANVFFKDYAAKGNPANTYMQTPVHGGRRVQKRFERALAEKGVISGTEFLTPSKNLPRDGYGNISRGMYLKVLSSFKAGNTAGSTYNRTKSKRSIRKGNQNFFVETIGGTKGIWDRVNTGFGIGVKLLFEISSESPRYGRRLPFFDIAENILKANYDKEFIKALDEAIKTKR